MSVVTNMYGRWVARDGDPWLLERFGDSHILFNTASNDTHVLNELAIATLEALRGAPATLAELFDRLDLDSDNAEVVQAYPRLLRDLDLLGLIFPVDA
ncbi:MAG: HPr-rel-A system PqqD family peptide chaperone [Magnetococcales bacterium]|nr:HPr-rel-A system PqqD family peptide chaperone [Magnetococcales bacterium]